MVEREMKLGAGPSFHLPDLEGVWEGVTTGPREELRLETVYYDTPDLRLARWRCSLRHRRGEGWTLKLPSNFSDGVVERDELNFPGEGRTPPREAVDVVRAYVRSSPLQSVAKLSTLRTRVRLLSEKGEPLAEVVDDEVTVLDGRRVAGRFRELEVELSSKGSMDQLTAIANRLRRAGAGIPESTSKLVRALGPPALQAAEVTPADLGPTPTAGEVVRHALANSLHLLMVHDPLVRLGGDPEYVHQARVGTRRMRSDLRLFRGLLDPGWANDLREELRWLAGELGAVRDAEVLFERMEGHARNLEARDLPSLHRLTGRLSGEVSRLRVELLAVMASDRYIELIERLVEAVRSPSFTDLAQHPAPEVLPRLVIPAWRGLRRRVRQVTDDGPAEELHQVRIEAKRARYAAEACEPVVGRAARDFARAAARLQTVLGEHQDSIVAQAWLRSSTTTRQAFVGGQLYAMEHAAAASARDRWREVWEDLDKRSLRAWMTP